MLIQKEAFPPGAMEKNIFVKGKHAHIIHLFLECGVGSFRWRRREGGLLFYLVSRLKVFCGITLLLFRNIIKVSRIST